MTDPKIPVTEDELHAYVDDELPAERRGDVEAWLAGHPDDAARVQSWRTMAEALHARYGCVAVGIPDSDRGCIGCAPAVRGRSPPSRRGAGQRARASAAMADKTLRLDRPRAGAGRDRIETRRRTAAARPDRAGLVPDV